MDFIEIACAWIAGILFGTGLTLFLTDSGQLEFLNAVCSR